VTVVLDDHLLRDWLARRDDALVGAVRGNEVATTNLWYARLCKTAAGVTGGAVLRGWSVEQRRALIADLVALPPEIHVLPIRDLAWRMGELIADHRGLSILGAEALAATAALGGRLLVSARDDGPGIRAAAAALAIPHATLAR
jgi:hypothetical protein